MGLYFVSLFAVCCFVVLFGTLGGGGVERHIFIDYIVLRTMYALYCYRNRLTLLVFLG